MPFQFTCEACGSLFSRPHRKPARYCSQACRKAPRPLIPQDDGTLLVPLNRGLFAIIDAEDAELIAPHKWNVSTQGYAVVANGRGALMHRLIAGTPEGMHTDHANGKKLDNRRRNLRVATSSQNAANRGKQVNNSSGYCGVSRDHRDGFWVAKIKYDGHHHWLGRFRDPEDAARAYDEAAVAAFGEFAQTNF